MTSDTFSLLSHSQVVLFAQLDIDGNCLFANELLKKRVGIFQHSFDKNPFEVLLTSNSFTNFKLLLKSTLKESTKITVELNDTKSALPIEIHPIFNEEKQQTGFTVIAPNFDENNIVQDKETYKELVTSTEQFNFLFSFAPIGMALVRPDGVLIRVSQSFCDVVGYSEAELLQTDFQSITHPDDLEYDISLLNKLLRGEVTSYQLEKRYVHKKGHHVWVLLAVTLPPKTDEGTNYVIAQIYDISQQKQALEAIIESEERYRLLTENSFDSMTLLNAQGECLYISPYVYKMTGFLPEEMISKKYIQFVHPDDADDVRGFYERVLTEPDKTHKHRHRFRCKNGQTAWVEGYATNALELKGLNAVIANFQDITELVTTTEKAEQNQRDYEIERKKSIDELRRSEANLKSIFNNTEIGYALIDNNGIILSFNKRLQDLYTQKNASKLATGISLSDSLNRDSNRIISKYIRQAIKEGNQVSFEMDYILPGQSGKTFTQIDIIPIKEGKNNMGICIACQDITNRKQAELEREKLTADMVGRNRDLEQFTYILSHNLRAPVASMLGLTRVLDEMELSEEDRSFYNSQVYSSAEQLDEVIRDLNQVLNLRRSATESKEPINLYKLVERVKEDLYLLNVENTAQIEVDFEIDEIYSLKSHFYTIFANLISNGIKFKKPDTHPVIRITTKQRDAKLLLSFLDNGIGIDLERKAEHMFGLYKRFHSHLSGKGMGLYMTKAHVEILGGTISVESEVNKGTTFIIDLSH
jgi:PAS domain S-box-containing protein